VEWLQLLHLEEYHDVLVSDGCYGDIDHVTDITWEDLEEIGIKKLGHQKKIMLAVDRLKKLKSAHRRLDTFGLYGTVPGPAASDESSLSLPQHNVGISAQSAAVFHQIKSTSRENVTTCQSRSYSSYLPADSTDQNRGLEIVHLPQPQLSSVVCHPEVVAIQVGRVSRTGSTEIPTSPTAPYESFHGSHSHDYNSFTYMVENPINFMSVSDDGNMPCSNVSPTQYRESCRARRASGGTTPCSSTMPVVSPLCRRGSQLAVASTERGTYNFQSSIGHGSAPSTPLHGRPPTGVVMRKVPPAPPRRTNSIKADSVLIRRENNMETLTATKLETKCSSLGQTSKDNGLPETVTDLSRLANNSSEVSVGESYEMDMEQQFDTLKYNKHRCANEPRSVDVGGVGDCSTLPFANENVGTIRPRGSGHSSRTAAKSVDVTVAYDESTGTVRRRDVKKPPKEVAVTSNSDTVGSSDDTARPVVECTQSNAIGESSSASHLFSDIGDLFDGLTHELEELLTETS
jgi:hypothetical protein